MTAFVLTFCVVFAVLYVVIRFDEWWQRRQDPPGRSPAGLPPAGGSAGRPGATTDDPWMP